MAKHMNWRITIQKKMFGSTPGNRWQFHPNPESSNGIPNHMSRQATGHRSPDRMSAEASIHRRSTAISNTSPTSIRWVYPQRISPRLNRGPAQNHRSAPKKGTASTKRHHHTLVARRGCSVRSIDAHATPASRTHANTVAVQAKSNASGKVGLMGSFIADALRPTYRFHKDFFSRSLRARRSELWWSGVLGVRQHRFHQLLSCPGAVVAGVVQQAHVFGSGFVCECVAASLDDGGVR